MTSRDAGILCHVTSLPGRFGQGTFGAKARGFVDALAQAGFTLWQILPLNPPNPEGSPYQSCSSRAIFPGFIDFDDLGALGAPSIDGVVGTSTVLDFDAVRVHRETALKLTTDWVWSKDAPTDLQQRAETFFETRPWLDDLAAFLEISAQIGGDVPWWTWPEPLRQRDKEALAEAVHPDRARAIATEQFLAYDQWQNLRAYAAKKGVRIVGDVPIYVAANSVDTWADPAQYQMSKTTGPHAVAGVPPDYFAKNGQLWGNPLYDWNTMSQDGYAWWGERLALAADLFDVVRIDHFRGFSRYWSVPAGSETAVEGMWVDGPGATVFRETEQSHQGLEIIAEDLGDIDDQVVALRDGLGFPGMRVIQFAFDGNPDNPHALQNHTDNSVCYLGTHDNPTTIGWLQSLDHDARGFVLRSIGISEDATDQAALQHLRSLTFSSKSKYALLTLQDAMGKGDEAIMNRPGEPDGNWQWRLSEDEDYASHLACLETDLVTSGRVK